MRPDEDTVRQSLELALEQHQTGNLAEAERVYREVLAADPDNGDALHLLGMIALQLGRNEVAVELIERSHRLRRPDPVSLNNLGKAYMGLSRPRDAKRCFAKALALKADYAETHQNLGVLNTELGRSKEAERSFRRAIALAPDYADAHYNLAHLLIKLGRFEEAERCCRRALAIKPDFAEAHHNLAVVLSDMGRLEEAQQCIRRALELRLDYSDARQNLIMWLDFSEFSGMKEHQDERRRWYVMHGKSYAGSITAHDNSRDPDRRLRIGYVSADFRGHSASYIFSPMIRHHDRSQFELYCYSNVEHEDDATLRFRKSAEQWRSILGVSDEALAEQIRGDRIDILVDLSGHSAGNKLLAFARKPAPVQITAWGHATGTGMDTMDYFLADPVLVPENERRHFAEEVIDLPCCVCYEAPAYAPEVSALPSLQSTSFTFSCVNKIEKISDRILRVWARILGEMPESRLLFKDQKLDDSGIRERLYRRLGKFGPDRDRLLLLGKSLHPEHLKIYHRADLALDPFPHGGGTSSLEALWMGVPVITLAGSTVPSRLSASILTALDMQDWIAHSDEEYVRKAVDAARDPHHLAQTRAQLRTRMSQSILGDVQRYALSVETVYRSLWRRWCERQTG